MFNTDYPLTLLEDNVQFAGARQTARTDTIDYESGGIELNDATEPFTYTWRAVSDGASIVLSKLVGGDWVTKQTLVLAHDDFSFTFDQNMNPVFAFTAANVGYIRFFDAQSSGYVNKNIGANVINPRVTLDDKRYEILNLSEIVCAYIKNGELFVRKQSEDYDIENAITTPGAVNSLRQIGMGLNLRILFKSA